jgi:hypothetical protein
MNILKQKEIMSLRTEAKSLAAEYHSKQEVYLSHAKGEILDSALTRLQDFLKEQGFMVTVNDTFGHYEADLDGIFIRVARKGNTFTVNMPNGEHYSISVDTDMSFSNEDYKGNSQDAEIEHLKKQIRSLRQNIASINKQSFSFGLHTEEKYHMGRGIEFKTLRFDRFEDIIEIMFS